MDARLPNGRFANGGRNEKIMARIVFETTLKKLRFGSVLGAIALTITKNKNCLIIGFPPIVIINIAIGAAIVIINVTRGGSHNVSFCLRNEKEHFAFLLHLIHSLD